MDSLGSLNAFVQAAETRSFTVAGRQLGVSSSAIGKAVARMEERLGVRLFHRSTRSITLTAEGALFLERCRRIFSEIEAAELELSPDARGAARHTTCQPAIGRHADDAYSRRIHAGLSRNSIGSRFQRSGRRCDRGGLGRRSALRRGRKGLPPRSVKAHATEPSLLVGVLVDARGERLTASHGVKKGRRYCYYVSTEAGTDRPQGWRLAAQEVEDAVINVLADALTRPAMLLERFDTAGVPGDQISKMLDRATRFAAALNRSPAERAKVVRDLIEKVVIEENAIMIRFRRSRLLGGAVMPLASENPSDSPIEFTAPVAFRRRGVEMKLVLPAVAFQNDRSRCDPTLIKAIARGRAWFEELAAGRARSLRELAERDGITRRYVRRLVDLAFLSPNLVEAILHGRQPVELTATRLTELDLPLDWTDQRRLLAN